MTGVFGATRPFRQTRRSDLELIWRLIAEGLVDPDRVEKLGDVLEETPPCGLTVGQHGVVGPFVLD